MVMSSKKSSPLWVKLSLGFLFLFLLFTLLMGSLVMIAYRKQRLASEKEKLGERSRHLAENIMVHFASLEDMPLFWEQQKPLALEKVKQETGSWTAEDRRSYVRLDYLLKSSSYRGCRFATELPVDGKQLESTGYPVFSFTETEKGQSHLLWASQCFLLNQKPVYLLISADLLPLDRELRSLQRAFIFCALPLIPLLALLIYGLTSHLTGDLKILSRAAASFQIGEKRSSLELVGSQESRQLAASLQSMWRQLDVQYAQLKAEKEREEQFSLALNHELKTPLAALLLHLDLLEQEGLPEEMRQKSLAWIRRSAEDMEKLREHILRLYLRESDVKKEKLELSSWLRAFVCEEKEKRSLPLKVLDQSHSPTFLFADALLLRQLLENLLDNAEAAAANTEKGTGLSSGLELVLEDGSLALVDHGPGVPENERVRLSELFYRGDLSRDRKHLHFGIGLAFCSRICELHAWELSFEETPGGGLTVRIYFVKP